MPRAGFRVNAPSRLNFLSFRVFSLMLETAEHGRGIGGVRANPAFVDGVDGKGVEMVPSLATAFLGHDEAGLLQDAQVLHDGAAIEFWKQGAKHSGGARFGLEVIKHAPAHAVPEGLENQIICIVG